jgi:hypothetical protein
VVSERGEFNTARIKLASLSWAGAWVESLGYQATVNAFGARHLNATFSCALRTYGARTADGYDVAERIVDHVVESCRIWLARNRVALPWLKRVTFGQLALQIARRDLHVAGFTVRQSIVQSMFTNEMGINQASTVVQRISAVCEAALRGRSAI